MTQNINDSSIPALNNSLITYPIFHAKTKDTTSCFIPHTYTASNDFLANSTEQELEQAFIKQLNQFGWKNIRGINLESYLKTQIERLNQITFYNDEWAKFYSSLLNLNLDELKQNNYCVSFLDRFMMLYDVNNWANNEFNVINQFIDHDNRYDVIFLINGLPFVHCELKTPNKQDPSSDLAYAFNQIAHYYKATQLHPLFRFVHLFLISNGYDTRYFANTIPLKTNSTFTYFDQNAFINNTSNNEPSDLNNFSTQAFKFSAGDNSTINNLKDVSTLFLTPKKLTKLLFDYCFINQTNKVFNVYRSYQIYAIEQAISLIHQDINSNNFNNSSANGYVWHATGTGKTLTSFGLVSQSSKINALSKIIVVVDTIDLYEQTVTKYQKVYNSNEQDIQNPNSSYYLYKMLNSTKKEDKVIITTIQKLNLVISSFYKTCDGFNLPVLLVFDECHRGLYDKQANTTNFS